MSKRASANPQGLIAAITAETGLSMTGQIIVSLPIEGHDYVIVRTQERIRQTGEVFTPLPLVDEILSKLPHDLWIDPSKTYLDNSCGIGNFLVRVIAFKIKYGSTAEQALSTTYGVELMPDNVEHCRRRLLIAAYWYSRPQKVLIDYLPHDYECTIFDSPPFKKFSEQYQYIVERNVVCHDALTYDYEFGEPKKAKTVTESALEAFEF